MTKLWEIEQELEAAKQAYLDDPTEENFNTKEGLGAAVQEARQLVRTRLPFKKEMAGSIGKQRNRIRLENLGWKRP